EFLFSSWVVRMAPLVLGAAAVSLVFMRFAVRPERAKVAESREYLAAELRRLGPVSVPERWGLLLFVAALLLVFGRSLYASFMPELHPAFVFLTLAVASFIIRYRGEPLLRWEYAQKQMVWGLFYLFAGGAALGRLLDLTGSARAMAGVLAPLAGRGEVVALILFSLMALLMTQITSNTAAVAIVIPITISTYRSLGLDPLPPVIIVTAVANCGLMLPSSSGGPAIAAGYGVNLKTMFGRGMVLALLLWLGLVAAGALQIAL
ncbi:MAG: SLC13 family permease, partial [Acidobacteriota bacterium]